MERLPTCHHSGCVPANGDSTVRLSRRNLITSALASAGAMMMQPAAGQATTAPGSANPASWRPWLLVSPDELRPVAPGMPAPAEIDELLDFQAQRTAETASIIAKWATGPAILPWTQLALDLIRIHRPSPVRAARSLALLHVAMYDAMVATFDARAAFPRPSPTTIIQTLTPLGPITPSTSSFPSEHAAIAFAAALTLAELFPKEVTTGLVDLAHEAAMSRLWAGACFQSDIALGEAIGRAVAERALQRAHADGSSRAWDGSGRLSGDGYWQPTPPAFIQEPLDPLAGTWRTWVVPRGDAYRPPPPPPFRSVAWQAELAAVHEAVARRTPEQEAAVMFWAGGPGTVTPAGIWIEISRDLAIAHGLDLPQAARALALTAVALADAFICCWDAKYTYWTARPITADPTLDVLIPTPPFPSYTSGHATASAAAATVLGHLFPDEAEELVAKAEEAKQSRLWAGIHFAIDNDMGATGGRQIGRLVVLRALNDGAEPQ
ncbi:MAG: haloperoxidase [Thermomicrobiales bacterium]|nr:MAG: haloperoxidase [Thermomicrobiales bacterium]